MLLALPLQGFAAASMQYCGMGPGHAAQAAPSVLAASHHAEPAAMGMAHDEVAHQHSVQADWPDQSADAASPNLPKADHSCGVCAACSHVMGVTDFPQTFEAQGLPQADLAEPFILIHAVPSRLPDKPPRV